MTHLLQVLSHVLPTPVVWLEWEDEHEIQAQTGSPEQESLLYYFPGLGSVRRVVKCRLDGRTRDTLRCVTYNSPMNALG